MKDWNNNEISDGDTIKLICFKELKNESRELIVFDIYDPQSNRILSLDDYLKANKKELNNNTIHVEDKAEYNYCFKHVDSYKVSYSEIPNFEKFLKVQMDPVTIFELGSFIDYVDRCLTNCIVAIEGKSDNEEEFFLEYFNK